MSENGPSNYQPVDISGYHYQWIEGDIPPLNWRFPEISPCLAASSVGLSHHDSTRWGNPHVERSSPCIPSVSSCRREKSLISLCIFTMFYISLHIFTYFYISLPFFPMKLPVSSIVIRPKHVFFPPGKLSPPWRPRTTSGISIISCARATNSRASFTSWVYKPRKIR